MLVIEGICIPSLRFGRHLPTRPEMKVYLRSFAEYDWVYLSTTPRPNTLQEFWEEFPASAELFGMDEGEDG